MEFTIEPCAYLDRTVVFIVNETLITYSAGKLRLGYPESTTSEEIPF